jgi:hypothetical protein
MVTSNDSIKAYGREKFKLSGIYYNFSSATPGNAGARVAR